MRRGCSLVLLRHHALRQPEADDRRRGDGRFRQRDDGEVAETCLLLAYREVCAAGEDRLCVHPFLSQRQPFHAAAGGTPEKDGGESGGGDTDISLRSGVHLMVYEGFARCGPLFPPPDGEAAGRHRDFLQRGNDFRRQDDPDFQRDRFRRYPDAERTERHFARAAPDRCGGGALLARVRPPGTGPRGVLPDESGI